PRRSSSCNGSTSPKASQRSGSRPRRSGSTPAGPERSAMSVLRPTRPRSISTRGGRRTQESTATRSRRASPTHSGFSTCSATSPSGARPRAIQKAIRRCALSRARTSLTRTWWDRTAIPAARWDRTAATRIRASVLPRTARLPRRRAKRNDSATRETTGARTLASLYPLCVTAVGRLSLDVTEAHEEPATDSLRLRGGKILELLFARALARSFQLLLHGRLLFGKNVDHLEVR